MRPHPRGDRAGGVGPRSARRRGRPPLGEALLRTRPAGWPRGRRPPRARSGTPTRPGSTSRSSGSPHDRPAHRSSSSSRTTRACGRSSRATSAARGYAVDESHRRRRPPASSCDGGLRPALVLLDLNLPGDTGWDLLRGARDRGGRLAAGRHHERDDGQPEAADASSASPATCPSRSRSRRSSRPSSGSPDPEESTPAHD